ncbi:MAG: hypothetical protein ACOY82_08105 [Pseudomonadota bacterium]
MMQAIEETAKTALNTETLLAHERSRRNIPSTNRVFAAMFAPSMIPAHLLAVTSRGQATENSFSRLMKAGKMSIIQTSLKQDVGNLAGALADIESMVSEKRGLCILFG